MLRRMTRLMLTALLALAACATVHSTLQDAHLSSLRTRAAADSACAAEQIQVSDVGGDNYRAQGCGKDATYHLTNPNCVVERDCIWEKR